MNIDFHSHILPHMDDGSESLEMSLAMLRAEQEQNVERVILTPHFYRSHETIDNFLQRRKNAVKQLLYAKTDIKLPELILGAEVAMTKDLRYESLLPLCIENTNTLLLELPYTAMNDSCMQDLLAVLQKNEVQIVLAHVERYRQLWGAKCWEKVMALPVYKQISCGALLSDNLFQRRRMLRWIANEQVHLLGTDAHNCTLRPVNMAHALEFLEKKGLGSHTKKMMKYAEQLSMPLQ